MQAPLITAAVGYKDVALLAARLNLLCQQHLASMYPSETLHIGACALQA
jgi:hypothetical protein